MNLLELLLTATLFGSMFWGITFLVGFIVICFIADINENGFWATIFLIIFGALFYFFGRKTFDVIINLLTWKFLIFYFSAGLVHAIIRVFFFGRNEMKKFNEFRTHNLSTHDYVIETDVKEHVFRWWFMWPISLITWIIKDALKDIYYWFYDRFSTLFEFVLNLGVKSVKEVPKSPDKK